MARGRGRKNGGETPAAEGERKPGRPRRPKVKDTIRTYTEQEKTEAKNRAITAYAEYLSKQGAMRNSAKAVTAAIKEIATMTGDSKKAVRWALENRNREPKDIDAETRERTRMAQFFGMPIGSQLGLFADGESVASKVEGGNGAMSTEESLKRARLDGVQAGLDGKSREAGNPHQVVGSPEYLAWDNGWLEGQAENVAKFKQPTHEPAHA